MQYLISFRRTHLEYECKYVQVNRTESNERKMYVLIGSSKSRKFKGM